MTEISTDRERRNCKKKLLLINDNWIDWEGEEDDVQSMRAGLFKGGSTGK